MGLDPFSVGLEAISGLSSLSGLLGASSARKQAIMQQQMAINQQANLYDQQYQDQVQRNHAGLMSAAGQGSDAIASLYSRALSDHGQMGQYNSTSDLGYRSQLAQDQASQLANLAANQNYNAKSLYNQGMQNVGQMRMNFADGTKTSSVTPRS